MKTRLITAGVGILILAGVLFLFDTVVFELVIAAICILAIHEVYTAFGFTRRQLPIYFAFCLLAFLVIFSGVSWVRPCILPAALLLTLFLCLCIIARHETLLITQVGGLTFFSGVILICFYSLVHLKYLLPVAQYDYDAIYFILLILCFAWGGDSAAYFAGRFFGKHKLAPTVSPHKTIEGAIGGVFGSVLMGLLATFIYSALSHRVGFFPDRAISGRLYGVVAVVGVVASVLGMLGDLFASAVKRQCGIKDYGTIFPGHGGILDRFDSVMFIAPLVSMVLTYVFYHFRG